MCISTTYRGKADPGIKGDKCNAVLVLAHDTSDDDVDDRDDDTGNVKNQRSIPALRLFG